MQAAFQPTQANAVRNLRNQFNKFAPRLEARLAENGTGLCVGARLTFADVVLAEALSAYLEWVPDILRGQRAFGCAAWQGPKHAGHRSLFAVAATASDGGQ